MDRCWRPWASCSSPKAYSGLQPGDDVFSARGTDTAGNLSTGGTSSWTVSTTPDATAPVVTITAVGTPGALVHEQAV